MNNQKLTVKDVILTGALTALMFIISMVISMVMSMLGYVTNVFYPPVVALVNGIVMMLLLAKVPKRGVMTISGVIQGLLFLLMGAFWCLPVSLIVGGIVGDLLIANGGKITTKTMTLAYAIFSAIFTFGAIAPINLLQESYIATCVKNGIAQDYIDGLIRMTSAPMLIVIVVVGLVCGFLGALLGQKMLNKHFVKAGLVSAR